MSSQIALNAPFVLVWTNGQSCAPPFVWGDQMRRLPLVGRGFHHGVTDCYALVRDYYLLEKGLHLREYPRNWEWWEHGQDLYSENFAREGFREVDPSTVKEGDALLFHIRCSRDLDTRVINHAGIYVGNGKILHHVAARSAWDPHSLSRVEPMGRWTSRLRKAVRHAAQNLPSRATR